ncbi:hypothetical protein, partial [Micromonospora sp. DT81.3]|uniref:hypothetical protein n=1 Tax=Micromonospora sp. DT81.3 TaxID=3416523 RepID=UPI003CEDF236
PTPTDRLDPQRMAHACDAPRERASRCADVRRPGSFTGQVHRDGDHAPWRERDAAFSSARGVEWIVVVSWFAIRL